MTIYSPKEKVYYYECSNGRFRLVYFIPPYELEHLIEQDKISPQVLDDFPEGVDLSCMKADFDEFENLYAFRPEVDPDAIHRAFFALFSATRDWETFQGSGFIKSGDLERHIETVEQSLEQENIRVEDVRSMPARLTLKQRRKRMSEQAMQQVQVSDFLIEMEVEGIDPNETLRNQKFSPIEMQERDRVEEVFEKLHLKGGS